MLIAVMAIAAAAIVAATYLVAKGYGGQMAAFPRDAPEFSFRPSSSADLMTLELPMSLVGFSEHATAVALNAMGGLLAAREAEVRYLREEVRRLGGTPSPAGAEPQSVEPLPAESRSAEPGE